MKIFKLALLLCLTTFKFSTASATVTALSELPVSARQAVSIWNVNFRPFAMSNYVNDVQELFTDLAREAPMRVIADFNGDQIDDYALLGEAGGQQFLIIVASGKRWQVLEVEKWSEPNFKNSSIPSLKGVSTGVPVYVSKASGSLADSFKASRKRDVLQLEAYLGSVRLFGIDGTKVRELKPQ